ncbi:hypothetical protein FRC03_012642 [Tulasnella sp. 419]|nr:hypothetical protein FRC02_006595 [Tulasnella sp. 418]KAG8951084.1 hypothetical protein FRC03_012642 [Tulasnella sp. 419]
MQFWRVALAGLGLAVASTNAQQTFTVKVGATGLTFDPQTVVAAPNDVVNFEFHAKNHTVTQSSFASPCAPLAGGVDSGYVPVAADATTFPVWSIRVQETTPLWFYCAQGAHCQNGMVFAINVNTTSPNTFEAFLQNAKNSGAGGGTPTTATAPVASATGSRAVSAAPSVSGLSSAAPAATTAAGGGGSPNAAARLAVGGVEGAATAVLMSLIGVAGGLLVL